jgi:hypothetical protein
MTLLALRLKNRRYILRKRDLLWSIGRQGQARAHEDGANRQRSSGKPATYHEPLLNSVSVIARTS